MQHDLSVILTWGQIFKLTFSGQLISHSTRLDETNAMPVKSAPYNLGVKSYDTKTFSAKTSNFDSFCALKAKPLTLGQNWEQHSESPLKELSNALFCSAVALLVPDLCADLWKVIKIGNKSLWKFYLWWPPVTSAMTWSKNDLYDSERSCSELSIAFLPHLSSLLSEIIWCGQKRPAHHGEVGWEAHPGAG